MKKFIFNILFAVIILSCVQTTNGGNEILSSSKWVTTVIKNEEGVDVSAEHEGFVGLAQYSKNNEYEFFNLDGTPRDDKGYFFVLPDLSKRVLVSTTKNYSRVVDITEINKNKFTYSVIVNNVKIFVEHEPVK